MISASLQQFIDIIAQALGKELEHTKNSEAQLPENPYVFTPSQQQLADCNAHIKKQLKVESRNNEQAMAYLQAPNAIQDSQAWAALSLQDIADFVIHPHPFYKTDDAFQTLIAHNLHAYAPAVQNCLFASLESVEISQTLAQALVQFHKLASDPNLAALCLRAMSYKPQALSIEYITRLIEAGGGENVITKRDANSAKNKHKKDAEPLNTETCVVIAGRYWQVLNNEQGLNAFMQNVVLIDSSYALFKGLYADLVKIPEIRNTLLRFIRQTERSNEVSKAIGALFAST
ncbi:MAG: hypothetical protein ACJAVV_003590 [Alphaproteobacteria bacterium]|jgi:hypothetical protein